MVVPYTPYSHYKFVFINICRPQWVTPIYKCVLAWCTINSSSIKIDLVVRKISPLLRTRISVIDQNGKPLTTLNSSNLYRIFILQTCIGNFFKNNSLTIVGGQANLRTPRLILPDNLLDFITFELKPCIGYSYCKQISLCST